MLFQNDASDYTIETTSTLQTIRSFPDPSFPFIISHLYMSKLSMPCIPWHWHDEMEFVWVKEGELTIGTTNGSHTLLPGEGIFFNHNVLHMLETEAGRDCEFFSIRFYNKLLFSETMSSLTVQYLHPILFSPEMKHVHLTTKNELDIRMLQLMREISEIYFAKETCYELLILSKLYALWAELNHYAKQHSSNSSIPHSVFSDFNRVSKAIHYIADHYTEPITLNDIAGSIHLSKSECCRCFKRAVGLSPIEYLIQYRVMEAVRKIQTKEAVADSISDLSASVGFNSASYFNKQFKRFMNCTPLEYRKKLLSGINETAFEKEFRDRLDASSEHAS